MFHDAAAQSQMRACDDAGPVLDWVITSRKGPARSLSLVLAACLVLATLATLAILAALRRSGLGDHGSTRVAAAILVCGALHFVMRRSRQLTERIVIRSGAIRIGYYQSGELIEQRRVKLAGLAIEYRAAGNCACSFLALRIDDRAHRPRRRIEIARHLTPTERAGFLRAFLEALRSTGANPAILDQEGSPLALNDGPLSQSVEPSGFGFQWRRDCVLKATSGPAR